MSLIVFVLQRKAANLERNGKREEKQEKKSHKPKNIPSQKQLAPDIDKTSDTS